jgi:hypothetical protein
MSNRILSKTCIFAVTSFLMLWSTTITAEAKPIKISNATTFDFKGCDKSSDGNDIICVGNFRNRDADKQITIYREGYFSSRDVSITDFNGKSYKADEIKVGNGKSCRTGCSSLELTLVEGVDYQTYFIFKDVSLPSSQIALLQMKFSGTEEIKIRKIPVGRQISSLSEAGEENNNTALKPADRTASSVKSISSCRNDKKTFVTAQTNQFFIYICGKSKPTDYVVKIKSDGVEMNLPLESINPLTAKYNASTYILTPQFFTLIKNGKK